MSEQPYIQFLTDLGFVPVETSDRKFIRGKFKITVSRNQRRTVIIKEISQKDYDWNDEYFEQDGKVCYMPVYRGKFIFDDMDFARKLFVKLGIIKEVYQLNLLTHLD